jgi:hypothetical protein
MSMPRIDRIAPNFTRVEIGEVTVWFSYETPVAYQDSAALPRVVNNDWSTTTGKHLATIDGGTDQAKMHRLAPAAFEAQLSKRLS